MQNSKKNERNESGCKACPLAKSGECPLKEHRWKENLCPVLRIEQGKDVYSVEVYNDPGSVSQEKEKIFAHWFELEVKILYHERRMKEVKINKLVHEQLPFAKSMTIRSEITIRNAERMLERYKLAAPQTPVVEEPTAKPLFNIPEACLSVVSFEQITTLAFSITSLDKDARKAQSALSKASKRGGDIHRIKYLIGWCEEIVNGGHIRYIRPYVRKVRGLTDNVTDFYYPAFNK